MAGRTDPAVALDLLTRGEVALKGRMPRSSNATFLVELDLEGMTALAVYKPERGERPLWDFPPGIYRREIAAYLLSEALGWGIVPPTAPREGPLGDGSLQLFVHADFRQHYFTLLEQAEHREALQRICLFDLVANNADRKSGHCLLGPDGRIWAIDNGLCFNVDPKLRTVIWDFAGEPLPDGVRDDLRRLVKAGPPPPLPTLLDERECATLLARAKRLAQVGRFPSEGGGDQYPWPPV